VDELRNQDRHWSRHAARYHDVFLDPFRPGVENPIVNALADLENSSAKAVIDLGCGTGPLLPYLVARFGEVYALDFAPGMIDRARTRLGADAERVTFLTRTMDDLADLADRFDVAVAVNSLVMPDVRTIDRTLEAIHRSLRTDGCLMAAVPAIDAIHYHTMLMMEQALDRGFLPEEAERYAAFHAEHAYYDFAFGRFGFQGLRQKFWQRFEIEYRVRKASFTLVEIGQLLYPWDDSITGGADFREQPRSWDWSFIARR
jgi:SAM-dependent methyltransferase